MKRYLSADEAAELLGVSKATLYAYVSRGLVRSEDGGGKSKARRYLAEDVRKLQERKEYRRNPAQVAQDALHWGTPLLDSSLTLITDDGLYYRGQAVATLALTRTIEQVAALFWTGDAAAANTLFEGYIPLPEALHELDPAWTPMQRMSVALALADDLSAYDLRSEAVARTGARILVLSASAITLEPFVGGSLAEHLRRSWQPDGLRAERIINAALILCADHELNVSSFTARVVASAEATPYAVVTAGLAALSGLKHGGISEQVEALFREIGTVQQSASVIAERLRRGERIPGFGHSLYPNGDPRAQILMSLLEELYPDAPELEFARVVSQQVTAAISQFPNIDFALAALARTVHFPKRAALTLFALGRTVGWIGHAIEQYSSGALIRPRARYVGNFPDGE